MFVFPDKPQDILTSLLLLRINGIISFSGIMLQNIVQRLSTVSFVKNPDFHKTAILIQRHASMIQQVSIIYFIEASFCIQKTDMTLQTLTAEKAVFQSFHYVFLFMSQFIWILWINGRKIGVIQRIFFAAQFYGSLLIINLVQQQTFLHIPLRMLLDQLPFHLELNNGDGFVHHGIHLCIIPVVFLIIIPHMNIECLTCMSLIAINGKPHQWDHIDPVRILQNRQVAVTGGNTQHIAHTWYGTGRCSHPQDIVVSPLDVHRMMSHQIIHDQMRVWTSVKNIAYHMQMIYSKSAHQIAEINDQLCGSAGVDDRVDDFIIIRFLICHIRSSCHQFLNNICKIFWQ